MKVVVNVALAVVVASAPCSAATVLASNVQSVGQPRTIVDAPASASAGQRGESKSGLGCPVPAIEANQVQPREISSHVGRYVGEDGEAIVVSLDGGSVKLTSGPMTFNLVPCGDGRFGTLERELLIAFTPDGLTVNAQGSVVARAKRGEATATIIKPQGAALPNWLDSNVPALLARYRIPAAAIAYIENGQVALTRVYGERRRGEPAGSDTLFNIASLSKPITAEVLLRLASRNRISLDSPMHSAWVDPDLRNDIRAQQLTTRMALQHRTGMPNWRAHTGNVLGFVVEPGSTFRYSGEGYTYAARYAEQRTKQPFEELAKQLVLQPLRMQNTAYTVQPSWKTRAAYPHDAQGRELPPLLRLDFSGACCVHSTVEDYAKFLTTVMRDRGLSKTIAAQRIALARDQRDEMCGGDGIPLANCPSRIGMGLGWMVFGYPKETVVTHTGVNEGERAVAFYVPERGIGLVVLTNGANGARLIRDITAAAYDNPSYLRLVEATTR